MKKFLGFALILVLSIALAACGSEKDKSGSDPEKESKKIVVGASNVPHAEILEEAKPLLKEKGIELEIETFQDYVLPNKALNNKELDANYFQHIPYLEGQIKENGYDFVNAGGIHIEPIALYSQKYKSIDKLPKGATIIMSSSVADHGRALSLLEKNGLITLKEGIDKTTATTKDIVENKKNLKFDADYEAALLPKIYESGEGDAVLINSNYAIDAGLNPLEDSIAIEDSESPYVNVIAVNKGDENKEAIKALVEVLHSKEIQDFILKEYKGAVVPADK
ncbi:MetQ/NlpA family ABC transporter substrate-binding protein [Peribacillus simplex]|uniref:MetQ/NlpA family ABC transporter substrate-binding protein n=1 Tax=Peribacillus simplex TaxID=1478 RepID=UPI000BA51476|nr:MetQ/NlpA family ABC transporter substrate-binding protein [Peribacillus simplex]PAK42439.1 methionine ABC transporter substrate-binding protein [Peribacillus simplex]